jgi:phage major head subunit gpT-like protein
MGQITSGDITRNLVPGLKTLFQQGWNAQQDQLTWKKITTIVDSTHPSEDYAWLGQLPAMREWTDERIPKGLSEYTYTIRNKKWEASVRVDNEALEDEQYGQIRARVQALPGTVARHQNSLVWSTLEANPLAYDGQNLIDTDHQEGASGTQSNRTTSALSATTLAAARAAMATFTDDQGNILGINGDLLLVPFGLSATARTILNADYVTDGTTTVSNIWKGSATLMEVPFLTDQNNWYLVASSEYVKPVIFQNRVPVTFKALTPEGDSDAVFMRDASFYGVRARYNVGVGDWRTIYGGIVA